MAIIGNTVKIELLRLDNVPIKFDATIYPGDMLIWDSPNYRARPVVAADAGLAAVAAQFIGIANDKYPVGFDMAAIPFGSISVIAKALVVFTVDDNATYYPGDGVTIGAGPQLIRHTGSSASNIIGVVGPENIFDASAGAPAGKVAIQGVTKLLIWLRPQFTYLTSY